MLKNKLDPRRKITTVENVPFKYGLARMAIGYAGAALAVFLLDRFWTHEEETVDYADTIDTTGTENK